MKIFLKGIWNGKKDRIYLEVCKTVVYLQHGYQFRCPVNQSAMTIEQIKANFKEAHGKAVQAVAAAQYTQMEAAAALASARANQQAIEKQFREDMKNTPLGVQGELDLKGGKK